MMDFTTACCYTDVMEHSGPGTSLFSRLMIFFMIVMLVPVLLLAFAYFVTGSKSIENNLSERGLNDIRISASRMVALIEVYRHKAYSISVDDSITSLVQQDEEMAESAGKLNSVYERMFSIMRGDTYLATASVVSTSGKVRLSTHLFPQQYDLRYQGNDTNPFFDLSRASGEAASLITLDNRYATRNNSFVFLNIFRRIRNNDQKVLGYVAVDIYQDTISDLTSNSGFSDIILIDKDTFIASSLVHMDKHGDFSRFPELAAITFPLNEGSFKKGDTIVSLTPIPNTQLFLAGVTDLAIYRRSIEDYVYVVGVVLALGALLAGILAFFFSRSISLPIDSLAVAMHKVEAGELETRSEESLITEIGQLQRSFNMMVQQITTLMELTREEEAKLQEAERKALEAQLNPHFLYNTLNTVKAIARMHDEKEIYAITTRLGKLLRNAIDHHEAESTLKESFELVESYLTIQRIRFGEKLHTVVELEESIRDVRVPKLIIQPLVENAIIHGLEPKVGNWRLTVKARVTGGHIVILVKDNGVGFPEDTGREDPSIADSQVHVGIYNIRRRLQLRYNGEAGLTIDSAPEEGTIISIKIPYRNKGALG